jgi:hypothetical protein
MSEKGWADRCVVSTRAISTNMTIHCSPGSPHATETKSVIEAHASITFLMIFAMTNRMKCCIPADLKSSTLVLC